MNSSSNPPLRLLLIDDTSSIHEDFRKILLPTVDHQLVANETALFPQTPLPERPSFEIDSAYQGEEGLELVERSLREQRPYAVAFVDMRMPPGWDGIETIRYLWAADPELQIVICTAHSDYSWEETVRNLGESDSWVILKKPFDNIEVLQLAHALSKKWIVTRRDRTRLADLDEMVRQRTAQLRRSEGRFVKAFHANPVAVTLQTISDGRYLDVNDAFLRLIGRPRSEVLQATAAELGLWPAGDIWQQALDSVETQTPLRAHRAQLCSSTGAVREVLISVDRTHVDSQLCLLSSFEDITDRIQLEQQLRQSQKMEAVGQLAAGIAHDFNNLLTVIQSYTGMALADPAVPAEHRSGLAQVRVAAERATALTRQLLVFSRRQITQPKPVDVAACVTNLRSMLARLLPAPLKLEWQCDGPVPRVCADEANLEQVIINLVVNARDALPAGGRIWVSLRSVAIDANAAARHADARPGRFVCLSVLDNGTGIEPSILPRIFEPFFTTKAIGQGTGLGLSTVYAIVRQHEGWIEVTSVPKQGTRFEIFLPALEEATPAADETSREQPGPVAHHGCGERILLVEDQEVVRHATRLIAVRAGYHVTEAVDAPSALKIWDATPRPFDVLLTDMVMPNGLNGAELAAQLRARSPALKVILSTGYSQDLLAEGASKLENAHLLLKPYTATVLLETLREALPAPKASQLAQNSAA